MPNLDKATLKYVISMVEKREYECFRKYETCSGSNEKHWEGAYQNLGLLQKALKDLLNETA